MLLGQLKIFYCCFLEFTCNIKTSIQLAVTINFLKDLNLKVNVTNHAKDSKNL